MQLFTLDYLLEQFLDGQIAAAVNLREEFGLLLLLAGHLGGLEESREPEEEEAAESEQGFQDLGMLIRSGLRAGDFVCRICPGGFAIVLPRCGLPESARVARRLLEQISRGIVDRLAPAMWIRIGLALHPADGQSSEDLLRSAEQELLASPSLPFPAASPVAEGRPSPAARR